jgi:hypothetical protein
MLRRILVASAGALALSRAALAAEPPLMCRRRRLRRSGLASTSV